MPSAQDFAERLRKQAYKTLSPQIGDLERELQEVAKSLSAGIQQIERRLDALRHIELPASEPILDEFLGESLRQKDLMTGDLVRFTRDLRQHETQEEILTLLLDSAQKCSPRIALYVVRGNQFIGWSSRGYSDSLAKEISSCSFSRDECLQFQEALESGNPTVVSELSEVDSLQLLGEEAQGPWHLFPMSTMQRPIALLLAGQIEDSSVRSDSISVLADFATLQLENIALRILNELTVASAEDVPQPVSSQAFAAPESAAIAETAPEIARETQALVQEEAEEPGIEPSKPEISIESVQEPIQAEETAPAAEAEESLEVQEPEPVEETAPAADAEESLEVQEPEPVEEAAPAAEAEESLEVQEPELVEEAAPAADAKESLDIQELLPEEEAAPAADAEERIESLEPEFEKSPALDAPLEAPEPLQEEPQEIPIQEAQPEPLPEIPEEERLHSDAKRFAKLLVSEIKLYNESRVVEGREHQDIYIRLKRDIDRSREMYEKRVSPSVSQKIDYFHDEIIRILGENDPSCLGSDYPGPRVES